jgi:predicted nucleic acid-binding protein
MAKKRLTADTSVVIPVVCAWHEAHAVTIEAAADVTCLPAHVLIEAIATLTRLPRGLAVSAVEAATVVQRRFPDRPMTLDAEGYLRLIEAIRHSGVRGGQVYDALVAATANTANAVLLTRDRRAEPAYRAVNAELQVVD